MNGRPGSTGSSAPWLWWASLGVAALVGCTQVGKSDSGSPQAVINLKNAVISGSEVKVVQVIGSVAEMPEGTYTEILSIVDGQDVARAKEDLRITNFVDLVEPQSSPVGLKLVGSHAIAVLNTSKDCTYTISGKAQVAGRFRDPSGKELLVFASNPPLSSDGALTLQPGQTGELRFLVDAQVQGILQEARRQGLEASETSIHLIVPHDGVRWRPNWPDKVEGGIRVGLKATIREGSSAGH